MAKSRKAGMGQEILFKRGLAEWFYWYSTKASTDIILQNQLRSKYISPMEPANDIVVLFANIIQEAK